MKVVFCACVLTVTLVTSAPIIRESVDPATQEEYNQRLLDYYMRGRRSNQFAVVSPCASATGVPHYHSPVYGYASGYPANAYPYMPIHPGRVYRDDEEPEMMAYSDADITEAPWARYNFAAIPAIPAQEVSGPAYGVFPNAKTGGCAIPLLVSCSPNVVQGRLVRAEPHSPGPQGGYRLPDHQDHHSTMVTDHLPAASSEGSHDVVKTQAQ